ncbi:kinase-like domain-containing protein [Mycena sanguinolenta]|nr:kinase-like domain-containing protein [Mycena sanguinolenta]
MSSPSYILPDLTGVFIDDGYLQLLSLLGSGAYGKVYKAVDTTSLSHDPAYYAVKCMPRFKPGTREAELQDNEISLHRMVSDHPGVITLHRHFYTAGFVFVVLDFSNGGDFFDALVSRKVFRGNPTLIKKTFGELLDAVEAIHKNSIYHRDLKPENILCNSAGTDIRLADFGLSTQVSVSTQFGCGSKFYMSPESMNRANPCYSARHSDLWALSIILTNMISGRYPWHNAELSDSGFVAFRTDSRYLIRALKLTRPANDLLQWCFHANPLRRPSLVQFREALDAIDSFSLEHEQPVAPNLPPIPLPQLPAAASTKPERAIGNTPSSADCEKTPKPAFPIHMPQPVKFFISSSSSSCSEVAGSLSSSSPPSSNLSSDCSAPSLISAGDSSPPVTRSTLLTQSGDMHLCNIPALAGECLIKRAVYPAHLRDPLPSKPPPIARPNPHKIQVN